MDAYEAPTNPDLVVDTNEAIEESANRIKAFLKEKILSNLDFNE